ncbi:alpha/beta hydrolase [Dongia deserti]|uniref:alpha/beta hydrolase n=1 Tax=Dongia deserti TaxID=2268030 RepID=UPI000E654CC1|nr:alpha/beta hydrolase [Dongia deserti]
MDTAYWDDAYSNGAYIPGGDRYPAKWTNQASEFRQSMTRQGRAQLDEPYGAKPRARFDLLLPQDQAKGLFVFVHGGYWMAFDKSSWSHLAASALDRGWAVALPSYPLCPDARISEITAEVAQAITTISERVAGPIVLAGHSAGGHLVTRMACAGAPLSNAVRERLQHIVSISGLHDLRPLLNTSMNRTLCMDEAEASRESPALLRPRAGVRVTCWVGSRERPEFLRQNALLANIWTGLGARMTEHQAEGRHHFDVIEDLADPGSALVATLLDA